jgi:DNA-binding response OmpR family regulator
MLRPHLKDSSILVVEDEPLIVMDISMAFEKTGAHLTTTNTAKHAKLLVEHDGLSAAILDHALSDGDATSLCTRLTKRGIPFLMYSGFPSTDDACKNAPHLGKPASQEQLLDAMEALIRDFQISNRPQPARMLFAARA